MTHTVKDCLERPRKVGAKYTGQDIQADDVISSIDLGFEAKRDRWNGYDPEDHVQVVKDWEVVEEKRAQLREAKMKEKLEAGELDAKKDASSSDSEDDDEADGGDKYAEEADVVGQHVDAKSRVTVRNLRIREDTAKYLKDLSASDYNPKNRIIKSTPEEKAEFRRANEAVARVIQLQTFAWDAEKRGQDVHIQANPTMGEIMYKQFHEKRKDFVEEQKTSVLAKYGGEEHLQAPPKELLMAQTEHYVEYTQDGKLLHGQDKPAIKSRYLEDMYAFLVPCYF